MILAAGSDAATNYPVPDLAIVGYSADLRERFCEIDQGWDKPVETVYTSGEYQ